MNYNEKALELLECLWVKFNNQPAPPKVVPREALKANPVALAAENTVERAS